MSQTAEFAGSEAIEPIAEAIHNAWRPYAPKGSAYDKDWAALTEEGKSANIAAASRMPAVLALAGLQIEAVSPGASGAGGAAEDVVTAHMQEHMERLAEAEHEGWMAYRIAHGWTHGEERDDSKKLHPMIKPYAELPESEKDKDRRNVLGYPGHIRNARAADGTTFRIVFADPQERSL